LSDTKVVKKTLSRNETGSTVVHIVSAIAPARRAMCRPGNGLHQIPNFGTLARNRRGHSYSFHDTMLITFEGLDFSGKSTQVKLLADRLLTSGRRVLVLREPGGTTIGEKIREILLETNHAAMTDVGEFLLFSASRSQLVGEVIRPALGSGTIVICDRFYDSSTAYQGWGRGVPLDAVETINALATGGLQPGVTFFLDIPVEEVERRIQERKSVKDRMESSGKQFYERVRTGYLELARRKERIVVLDGSLPVDSLSQEIWRAVEQRIHANVKQ
jgi:dTMP kinase